MKKFDDLRKEYPVFTYDELFLFEKDGLLNIKFRFIQSDNIIFEPVISFSGFDKNTNNIESLYNSAFNLGMIELISYYKACCSPKIIIKAGFLNNDQVKFWKKIYINGLGEFLFKNKIDIEHRELFDIEIHSAKKFSPAKVKLENSSVIPVGGGKDSVVTLELLKNTNALPFMLNPGQASFRSVKNAGYKNYSYALRKIDPKLLELNKKGYLNGHTPFSALLAFVLAQASLLNRRKHIVLSNENSANECNIRFAGIDINHQYSKSFDAEKKVHDYIIKYIHKDINYFSFLRPIHELKIAELFSRFKIHFNSFRSCNAGSRKDVWCGNCPKCLFTYIILSPFIPAGEMINIFGQDMFDRKDMQKVFTELAGLKGHKPFECVGTYREVRAALNRTLHMLKDRPLPFLLKLFKEKYADENNMSGSEFEYLLNFFDKNNLLNDDFDKKLRGKL